jgi:hypothetical protein
VSLDSLPMLGTCFTAFAGDANSVSDCKTHETTMRTCLSEEGRCCEAVSYLQEQRQHVVEVGPSILRDFLNRIATTTSAILYSRKHDRTAGKPTV